MAIPTKAAIPTDCLTISPKLFLPIDQFINRVKLKGPRQGTPQVSPLNRMTSVPVRLVDEEIARQLQSPGDFEGLTGVTINMEEMPRSELPDASQDFGSTIDKILQDDELEMSFPASIPQAAIIPDSLQQMPAAVMQTPNAPSSLLSMSSVLRASVRHRSTIVSERHTTRRLSGLSSIPGSSAQKRALVLPDISSALFDDDESVRRSSNPPAAPPLALFDLSGTIPSTNQVQFHVGRFSESAQSFQTGVSATQMLVPATQHFPAVDPVLNALYPTTPTVESSGAISVEIPPTQYPVQAEARVLVAQTQMSQLDLFAIPGTESETVPGTMSLTEPSEPSFASAIVCTPSFPESMPESMVSLPDTALPAAILPPSQPIEIALPAPAVLPASQFLASIPEEPFSGHDTVMLPDSADDEEDNPFIDQKDDVDDDLGITEPPVLLSQNPNAILDGPTLEPDESQKENEASFRSQDAASISPQKEMAPAVDEAFQVPTTGRKVRFAPTPVDSSQPPPPMAIHEAVPLRPRTDTQEMGEAFTTSLHKLCQQVVTVPRNECVKTEDVDDRITAEGEIAMRPKTPLRIVSRGTTPVKPTDTAAAPQASSSKTLSRILQAITPQKNKPASGSASFVGSPASIRRPLLTPRVPQPGASATKATPHRPSPAPIMVGAGTKSANITPQKKPKPMLKNVAALIAASRTADATPKSAPRSLLRKRSASPEPDPGPQVPVTLREGLLVWAQWRLQYYTVARVERKKSKSREIWQVRPLHRSSSLMDCAVEQLMPLQILKHGDSVLHIQDRRRYKVLPKPLIRLSMEKEEVHVEDEVLPLKDVVIDRNLFMARHGSWERIEDELVIDDEEEPRYSFTGKGEVLQASLQLFFDLSFVLTGITEKQSLTDRIQEHGGTIIEDLDSSSDPQKTILICSDATNKTAKFYCAILLGMERLKPSWIEACIANGQLAPKPSHRLEPARKCLPRSRTTLFSGLLICFIGSRSFKHSCEQVAGCCADLALVEQRRLNSIKDRSVMVVAENAEAMPARLRSQCADNGHLVFDKAWFTDSILQGRLLP